MTFSKIIKSTFAIVIMIGFVGNTVVIAQELLISGSTTLKPVMTKVVKDFITKKSRMNPRIKNTQVTIGGGGSGKGVVALSNSQITMAMMARDITDGEKSNGLVTHQIGIDGVAIVVNIANPVSSISREQLAKLFSGEISDWSELGGTGEISVVVQPDDFATTRLLEKYIGLFPLVGAQTVTSSKEALSKVISNPSAVAYASLGLAEKRNENSKSLKLLTIEGVEASNATVLDNSYPIPSKLYLVTKGNPSGTIKDVINYFSSAAGKKIMASFGLSPN